MTTRTAPGQKSSGMIEGQPHLQQPSREIQGSKQMRALPLGLPEEARGQSVAMLNQLLADSVTLYHLYKKHHWQVAGPTFYQLHLLFDKHAEQVLGTLDLIGERIQMLGGVSVAMPFDVAERTKIERPPLGIENVPAMLARTVRAHEAMLRAIREGIVLTEQNKDFGTNDLLVSDILRLHELQVWFVSQHLVDTPFMSEENGHRA